MKVLNIILREKFDLKKLSAVPRIAWETAKRTPKEFKTNIISNSSEKEIKKFNQNIQFVYLPGSYFSFFNNAISFCRKTGSQNTVYFLGSLSGAAVFSQKAKSRLSRIVLNIINGGIGLKEFKFVRPYDFLVEPSHCLFHPSVLGKPLELLYAKHLQGAHIIKIIVQSKRLKNKILLSSPQAKVEQIPFGVPKSFLKTRAKTKSGPRALLYFGHIYSVRGVDDMLASASLLLENKINFEINLIITPETNIKFLEKRLSSLPQVKAKTTLTKKYLKNLIVYLQQADLAFFLYRFSGEMPEYPLALIETMAAGIPVISTKIGAIGELFPKSTAKYCLTEPGQIKDIARKSKELLFNQKVRNIAIKTNQKIVEEMTWEKYYDKVKKFIFI